MIAFAPEPKRLDIDSRLVSLAEIALSREGPVVFLTGAGISAQEALAAGAGFAEN